MYKKSLLLLIYRVNLICNIVVFIAHKNVNLVVLSKEF